MPPVPAFYTRPETVADIVDDTVGRVLQRLGLPVPGLVEEWPGDVLRDQGDWRPSRRRGHVEPALRQ